MAKYTENERKMLRNLIENDFDGGEIWSDCWDCGPLGRFLDDKAAAAVIGSLANKGLVKTDGEVITITDAGREVYGPADPFEGLV